MKKSRLIVIGIAVGCLTFAALLIFNKSPKVEIREVKVQNNAPPPPPPIAMTEILVANAEIGMGKVLIPRDLRWQKWPQEASNPSFINRSMNPKALEDYVGAIARSSIVNGEPIRATKVVKAGSTSFMAAMITAGMRGVAVPLSPETGAGGFILPNDRVDVILVRRSEGDARTRAKDDVGFDVTTVLQNIRALAVDQTIEEINGQKTVLARTATLELTPEQAETLSLAKQLGTLNLTLRSAAEDKKDKVVAGEGEEPEEKKSPFKKGESRQLKIIKFGVSAPVAAN
jgi:pilus assembly protein CpaB